MTICASVKNALRTWVPQPSSLLLPRIVFPSNAMIFPATSSFRSSQRILFATTLGLSVSKIRSNVSAFGIPFGSDKLLENHTFFAFPNISRSWYVCAPQIIAQNATTQISDNLCNKCPLGRLVSGTDSADFISLFMFLFIPLLYHFYMVFCRFTFVISFEKVNAVTVAFDRLSVDIIFFI